MGHRGRDIADRADLVREVAGELVDVVREVAPDTGGAGHVGLTAELAVDTDVARDARHLRRERRQRVGHVVDRVDERRDLAACGEVQFAIEVAVRDRGDDRRDAADLLGQVARHDVDVIGELAPRPRHAADLGLTAEHALETDLARDARDLARERVELIDHRVDGVLELEQLAADLDGDLPGQVAVRDGRRDVGDVADLVREVRRHLVDVVGQLLPRAGDAAHRGLTAELALDTDVARDARDLVGERRQRIDHRVDHVLEIEQLAANLDGDLARHVAARDRGGDRRDVADLVGQVRRHLVDVVGQLLPRAADADDRGLAAELALGTDLARDARDLVGEPAQLIDHRVDRVLELEDLAARLDDDLLLEVAVRDRGRDLRDVADLLGQVRRHRVDVVGQLLPDAADVADLGLAAEHALGADLARDAGDLRRERVQLIDHRVDRVLQRDELAARLDRDLAAELAVRDRGRHLGDVADLVRQVARHLVDVVGQLLPDAADVLDVGGDAERAFGTDEARDARDLGGEPVQLVDRRVDRVLEREDLALRFDRDLLAEVTAGDRRDDIRDLADLRRQVRRHAVDVLGQLAPHAGDVRDLGLTAEHAFGTDLARHARHLRRERRELIDHDVDRVLERQDLALGLDGDLLAEVTRGDGARHLGDVADLERQVVRHRVDRLGQLAPHTRHAAHRRLAAEAAFGTDLASDARHLVRERAELLDHRVDRVLELVDLALDVDRDHLGQIALGDRRRHARDLADLGRQVRRHEIYRVGQILPHAADALDPRLRTELAFGADLERDARHLGAELREPRDHAVDDLRVARVLAAARAVSSCRPSSDRGRPSRRR